MTFFFLAFILYGCAPSVEKVPDDVMSKDEMVNVLVDMHIREKEVGMLKISYDSAKTIFHSYAKESVLEKYKIDEEYFDRSFTYYENNLEHFGDVYERVIDSLNVRNTKYQTEKIRSSDDKETDDPKLNFKELREKVTRIKKDSVENKDKK